VSGFTVNSAGTQITATFTITTGAALTTRNIGAATPSGATNTVAFTVLGPTLTGVAPNSGARGTTVGVTLTGTNLTGTTAVTVSGSGVTASAVTVVDSTHVTANFTITTGAALTARNVTVTTNGANSPALAAAFTVVGPTLTTIAPASHARNSSFG